MDKQLLIKAILAFFGAGVIAAIMSPVAKLLAIKLGIIDVPKDARRMHKKPTPLLGGLAIYIGFMSVTLALVEMTAPIKWALIGATIIMVLGIFDDKYALPAKPKFVIQILAASLPVIAGMRINFLSPFRAGFFFFPDWFAVVITILWIVGVTNAINFIDGLDGLACGVSSIACVSLLIISLFTVGMNPDHVFLLAALAGACSGFLPYNINPAKMFMGDTGATFLGYILAIISIQGMFKTSVAISFIVPLLCLGLPIFDTAFAITRRVMAGKSPMQADRGHLHHRLIDLGLSQRKAVGIIYMICALCGGTAIGISLADHKNIWWIVLTGVILGVVILRYIIHLKHEKERRDGTRED